MPTREPTPAEGIISEVNDDEVCAVAATASNRNNQIFRLAVNRLTLAGSDVAGPSTGCKLPDKCSAPFAPETIDDSRTEAGRIHQTKVPSLACSVKVRLSRYLGVSLHMPD